jgi:integrase
MARRSSGQIQLRPRAKPGPDAWRISVQGPPDPVTGKRRRIYRTVRGTKRDAERALARLGVEVEDGAATVSAGTVGELLDRWHATMTASRWRPATSARHAQDIELLRPLLGRKKVDRLTVADVDDALAALVTRSGTRPSPRTIRAAHQTLHAALELAVRRGLVGRNVSKLATLPAQRRRRGALPTDVELDAVLVAAQAEPRWATFLAVAFATGARPGELCALRWRHVDLERAELVIEDAVHRVAGEGIAVGPTKTDETRRVALDLATVAVLRRWRTSVAEVALTAGAALDPGWFVFAGEWLTRPPSPDLASKAWRRFVAAAVGSDGRPLGIDPAIRLYDAARHRHISWCLSMGFDLATVAERVGNSPETIARHYAHVLPGRNRAIAEALDQQAASPTTGGSPFVR